MPSYKVTIVIVAEIEAPNVIKAKQVAQQNIKLPGLLLGGHCQKNDCWSYQINFNELWISNPTKTINSE